MNALAPTSLDAFARITQRVIARDGFEGYLPTALYPARRHILVLEGVPADVNIEAVSLAWAEDNAVGSEEFLVAFAISGTHFKVIHRFEGAFESGLFPAVPASVP